MIVNDIKMANGSMYSYGLNHPTPPTSQFLVDVSNLRDPVGQAHLRDLTGRHSAVQDFVNADPRLPALIDLVIMTLNDLCPPGTLVQPWISVGFMDHHGVLLAPAVLEIVSKEIEHRMPSYDFIVRHYGLELPVDYRPRKLETFGGRVL